MSGQFLRFGERDAVAIQFRDVGVPPRRVEIRNPVRRDVRDADALQILLDHQPRFPLPEIRKKWIVGAMPLEPFAEHREQVRMQRQHVGLAML